MTARVDYHFDDFTEDHYRTLLAAALARYQFVPFTDFQQDGPLCLWRHDVDYSLHRARRLAAIEAENGVSATYFLNVHSEFCSVLGETSAELVRDIIGMGHRVGLHFDAGFYAYRSWTPDERPPVLQRERQILESMFGVEVECYSIHNPTAVTDWNSDETLVAGMVNIYCAEIRSRFTYVSDSNGIWWRGRLSDILQNGADKLHVLTHPEWWTPEAMSPRERIARCIDGRARSQHEVYDQFLMEFMRPNVGAPPAPERAG